MSCGDDNNKNGNSHSDTISSCDNDINNMNSNFKNMGRLNIYFIDSDLNDVDNDVNSVDNDLNDVDNMFCGDDLTEQFIVTPSSSISSSRKIKWRRNWNWKEKKNPSEDLQSLLPLFVELVRIRTIPGPKLSLHLVRPGRSFKKVR